MENKEEKHNHPIKFVLPESMNDVTNKQAKEVVMNWKNGVVNEVALVESKGGFIVDTNTGEVEPLYTGIEAIVADSAVARYRKAKNKDIFTHRLSQL